MTQAAVCKSRGSRMGQSYTRISQGQAGVSRFFPAREAEHNSSTQQLNIHVKSCFLRTSRPTVPILYNFLFSSHVVHGSSSCHATGCFHLKMTGVTPTSAGLISAAAASCQTCSHCVPLYQIPACQVPLAVGFGHSAKLGVARCTLQCHPIRCHFTRVCIPHTKPQPHR